MNKGASTYLRAFFFIVCTRYLHKFILMATYRCSVAAVVVLLLQTIQVASSFTKVFHSSRTSTCLQISPTDRRDALAALASSLTACLILPTESKGAVTDETDTFANTDFDSSYRGLQAVSPPIQSSPQALAAPSDEISLFIPKSDLSKGLGLELGQIEFRTNTRVFVKSVTGDSLAEKLGIQTNWIVVSVNGQGAERTNAEGVAIMVARAAKNTPADGGIVISFRDPAIFKQKLKNMASEGEVTTQVAPAGDTTQRNWDGSVKLGRQVTDQVDQRISVSQLIPPKMCNRGATTDDLLEISYLGTVVETGAVFDGSAIRINGEAIPGRGNDVSLFFVLNKQPFGQFPPGWDVGLYGTCVGERRRVIIPPALAYGSVGVPRRGIPPDATLQYDITLISLNGLAMPQ